MRINTNIAALRACYQLGASDNRVSNSIAKLSSGNKLIDIKENPVGASLSVKMKTQIKNLDRASQNTSDGISVVETAESALSEIHSMLQRVNELAVQGASDTYTDSDRDSIMDEIDQIRQEIDRVSSDTDFNTKTLLDGTLEKKTFTSDNYAEVTYTSDTVASGMYAIAYRDAATQAKISLPAITAGSLPEGDIDINGAQVNISAGDTLSDIYEKFRNAADKTGLSVAYTGSLTTAAAFTFTQQEYGSDYKVDISTGEEMAAALGLADTKVSMAGEDSVVNLFTKDGGNSEFRPSAVCTVSGRDITVKDYDGFEMRIRIKDNVPPSAANGDTINIGVTDAGAMTIQVGANEYQEMEVEIPRVDSETLGLNKIRAYTSRGSGEAITISAAAIARVSEIRSKLGAYQNRMEHTVSTLEVTEENMTASLSRIEDVDMADEMTKYTTYNVMTQAATSMLAQANQMPDKVLQLLQ